MSGAIDVRDRFDGAAVWAAMSPAEQAAFGAASLEIIAAERGAHAAVAAGREEWERPCLAAHTACTAAAEQIFDAAVDGVGILLPDGQPRIPSLVGMVCRLCGCSQDDACEECCGWAAEDLCTSCAPAPEPSAGEAQ